HRRAVVLPLQAHEGAAVEFEGESEAGHKLGLSSLRTAAGGAAIQSWGAYGSGLLRLARNDEWGDITSAPSPPARTCRVGTGRLPSRVCRHVGRSAVGSPRPRKQW